MRTVRSATTKGLVAGLSLALTACFQGAAVPEPPTGAEVTAPGATAPDPVRSKIVFTALQMVGVPYRYGGEAPDGFDCSGLVQYAYRSAGVSVPRTARAQLDATTPVALAKAREGDLIFFRSKDYSHVGIYLGQGRFVHAPSTGNTVSIASFGDAWYRRNFVRAGRIPEVAKLATACGRGASPDC